MSEITQPPPDVQTQDPNARVNRLSAASDQSSSNKQSAEKQASKNATEVEQEKTVSHHDPAVTLASTLSKLDSGSHFEASVEGRDGDGRLILTSELGTYLVEADQKELTRIQIEELKKLQKEENLQIRVITIDKEIKAEILKTVINEDNLARYVRLPVTLTLTELAQQQTKLPEKPLESGNYQHLDEIRSQYQATTLYNAERIAREIGEKLDNLPLPTSLPNYTVYSPRAHQQDESVSRNIRQVSSNVFIQEISSSPFATPDLTTQKVSQTTLNQILGKDVDVQVIKTVPQEPALLLAGLPESVIRELNLETPLDHVVKGQSLTINIAAIAIPETGSKNISPENEAVQSAQPHTLLTHEKQTPSATTEHKNEPETRTPVEEGVKFAQNTVVSGIIVDATTKTTHGDNEQQYDRKTSTSPYVQKNSSHVLENITGGQQKSGKPYYLATPNAVLKFQSETPLTPGTIVSFTIGKGEHPPPKDNGTGIQTNRTAEITDQGEKTNSVFPATQSGSIPVAGSIEGGISQSLLDQIDQFKPQSLDQLSEDWASISLAMSALTSTNSAAIANALASRIPNMLSPEQITSTIFFFLSAIKSPTPTRTWIGPDISEKLKQLGAGRILDRVDHDLSRIARLGAESRAGEWRPFLIPFQSGPDVSAVPMIVRQVLDDRKKEDSPNDTNDDSNKIEATRFILEVKFSQFGKVVLDGFLKPGRLDIILKSTDIIPYAIKTRLSRQYNSALGNTNFAGELVIIDNTTHDISVTKMIDNMIHKDNYEKKI